MALTLALLIVAVPYCDTDTGVNACSFSKRLLLAMRAGFDLEANPPAEPSKVQALSRGSHFAFRPNDGSGFTFLCQAFWQRLPLGTDEPR